jgi:hypothetical protein
MNTKLDSDRGVMMQIGHPFSYVTANVHPLDKTKVMRMKMISPSNVAVDIGQTLKLHEYIGINKF